MTDRYNIDWTSSRGIPIRYKVTWPDGSIHSATLYDIETELGDILIPSDIEILEDLKRSIPIKHQGRPGKKTQCLE